MKINDKPICILLIHGFGGDTQEVEPLALRLSEENIPTFMVEIAGHSIRKSTIENISYVEWIDSVRQELISLREKYRIITVGFSMGGLISAILNCEEAFEGMIFINTPIYFWNLPQVLKNFFDDFNGARKRYSVSAGQVTPYTLIQFLRLLIKARKCFKEIDAKALVVQSRDDDTVWQSSAAFICKKMKQTPEFYSAESGGHAILLNKKECEIIAKKVIALYEITN